MNKRLGKGDRLRNFLLTGPPGCGKTTVIRKVVEQNPFKMTGFLTGEIRKEGRRIGFMIETLTGRSALLAHRHLKGPYRIGSYGVSIENIDTVAVPSMQSPDPNAIVIIDEIGKMECLSEMFRNAVTHLLASDLLILGSIPLRGGPFINRIWERRDVALIEVNPKNRDELPQNIIETLHQSKSFP